ncbi:MAG: hypothetical protein ACR2O4_06310 [Hyphomicrobiaceae bacterium]
MIDTPIRKEAKLCGIFSGDSHHYSRYTETDKLGNFNLITAGGAGAYAHGTYHLRPEIDFHWVDRDLKFSLNKKQKPGRPSFAARAAARVEPEPKPMALGEAAHSVGAAAVAESAIPSVTQDAANPPIATHMAPKRTNQAACYPSKTTSRIRAWSNFAFPFRNKSFALGIGIIYLLLTWTFSVLEVPYSINFSTDEISSAFYDKLRGKLETRGGVQNLPLPPDFMGPPGDFSGKTEVKSIETWTLIITDIFRFEYANSKSTAETFWILLLFFGRSVQLLLLGIAYSLPAMAFMLVMWSLFVTIAQSRLKGRAARISRLALGTAHFGLHLMAMWALYAMFTNWNDSRLKGWLDALDDRAALAACQEKLEKLVVDNCHGLEKMDAWLGVIDNANDNRLVALPIDFWVRAAGAPEMILGGALLGGLIFGLYLTVGYHFAKINEDWVFSSQRLKGYKCFLRMKFEPDRLTIYPIGLHNVPSSRRIRSAWFPAKPNGHSRSLLRPFRKLKPHLIEGPIVINVDEVNNIPRD